MKSSSSMTTAAEPTTTKLTRGVPAPVAAVAVPPAPVPTQQQYLLSKGGGAQQNFHKRPLPPSSSSSAASGGAGTNRRVVVTTTTTTSNTAKRSKKNGVRLEEDSRYLKPGLRKGPWTEHEDAIVMAAVTTSSEQPFTRWSDLAQQLPGRVGKQIRTRWKNRLNPSINPRPFSREDDLLLWEGITQRGKRWVELTTTVFQSTRSENQLKNRWCSASFKKFVSNEFGIEAANEFGIGPKNEKRTVVTTTSKSKGGTTRRRGRWTVEEEVYVARLIQDFNSGFLDAPAGYTLRSFLSDKLQCDPMRITKKFTGDSCIGKRVFHPAVRSATNSEVIDTAQVCVSGYTHNCSSFLIVLFWSCLRIEFSLATLPVSGLFTKD